MRLATVCPTCCQPHGVLATAPAAQHNFPRCLVAAVRGDSSCDTDQAAAMVLLGLHRRTRLQAKRCSVPGCLQCLMYFAWSPHCRPTSAAAAASC